MADIYGQIVKAQFENLGSDPGGTPPTGLVWYNTGSNVVKWYDATAIRTAADIASTQTLTNKTISGASNTLTVRAANDITGTLALTNGGTGVTSAAAIEAAITPLTTKGDINCYSTLSTRLGVGSDGQVLSADSAQTTGLKWVTSLTTALTSAHLFVGNGSNIATDTAITGDVTISNAGATSLAATISGSKTWNDVQTFKYSTGTGIAGVYTTNTAWTWGLTANNPSHTLNVGTSGSLFLSAAATQYNSMYMDGNKSVFQSRSASSYGYFDFRQYNGTTDAQLMELGNQTTIATGYNGADAVMFINKANATGRSVNAAGTVNVAGTDYAEYMAKQNPADVIAKGEICGINSNGKLTKKFSEARSFVIKSTDPGLVGGDFWGVRLENESDEDLETRIASIRLGMDRIAFCGQVPCLVSSASAGDWIVPVQGDFDAIVGRAVKNAELTFDQFKMSLGRVIAVSKGTTIVGVGMK